MLLYSISIAHARRPDIDGLVAAVFGQAFRGWSIVPQRGFWDGRYEVGTRIDLLAHDSDRERIVAAAARVTAALNEDTALLVVTPVIEARAVYGDGHTEAALDPPTVKAEDTFLATPARFYRPTQRRLP